MEQAARSKALRPVVAVVITLAVGLLSGLSMRGSLEGWYVHLQRPSFAPPNWLFGPVWTLLYILMGTAAGLVWNEGVQRPAVRIALLLYALQLVLNAAWSFIFFGMQKIGWALAEMVLLWLMIAACTFAFVQLKRTAAWLMVPYIGWVSFALLLNAAYAQLNQ